MNIGLMLLCWALAYRFPIELLLVSYAVLGPAHYLTEISWLHDRDYYAVERRDALALVLLAGGAMLWRGKMGMGCLWAAFAVAACAAFLPQGKYRLPIAAAAGLAAFFLGPMLGLFWTVMLPTAAHVFLFTLLFVVAGALKTRSGPAFASAAVLVLCAASFFFYHPFGDYPLSETVRHRMGFFMTVDRLILGRFGLSGYDKMVGVMGFLSFAYTYHYLNWFSKAEVIKWHQTPKERWVLLGAAYAVLLGVYAWDFDAGFAASSFLSMAHVALEFPLDFRTAAGLFRAPTPAV